MIDRYKENNGVTTTSRSKLRVCFKKLRNVKLQGNASGSVKVSGCTQPHAHGRQAPACVDRERSHHPTLATGRQHTYRVVHVLGTTSTVLSGSPLLMVAHGQARTTALGDRFAALATALSAKMSESCSGGSCPMFDAAPRLIGSQPSERSGSVSRTTTHPS